MAPRQQISGCADLDVSLSYITIIIIIIAGVKSGKKAHRKNFDESKTQKTAQYAR